MNVMEIDALATRREPSGPEIQPIFHPFDRQQLVITPQPAAARAQRRARLFLRRRLDIRPWARKAYRRGGMHIVRS